MMDKKIAIIGGGLSGLYAAYLLEQQGITDYLLLEARDNFGGRIQSFTLNNTEASFDLGPAWFWPDIQPEFAQLINDFQLDSFAQYDTGNMLIERSLSETPNKISGFVTEPTSMRLTQGMSSLIKTISEKLTNTDIHCSKQVTKLERQENKVIVHYHDSQKNTQQMATSDHVLLALPPRLAIEIIEFTPSLPETLTQQWQSTATWMAPHAKYIAVYERPFWREQQLSGSVRSMVGPMVEIHDASLSTEPKHAALFGFIGIPAQQRKDIGEEQIKAYCQQQLVRLFGEQAVQPTAHMIKDWAQEAFTATTLDSQALSHSLAPPRSPINSTWSQHLTGIGSEWATEFPGYLAGATEAAELGVERYMALYEK
ncbi:flavin monoamine oxidase family protein [Photobacterium angustum]|uniref:flavin monoamine oxidase family protein n=1 Tax=Photobacterium angustum TaxID=661 RepID=UPI0005E7E252|nr:FAD-dependent oxidoreductase [Photobacterium angustum]KJG01103.1 amine oxidase [Photobacterium angustum]PSV69495.1 amine oxidase [Photobacterium angustum]